MHASSRISSATVSASIAQYMATISDLTNNGCPSSMIGKNYASHHAGHHHSNNNNHQHNNHKQQLARSFPPLQLYLNAVCMACMEGWSLAVRCKECKTRWSGAQSTLGSMYMYDIFAAAPCCAARLRCKSCQQVVRPRDKFPSTSSSSLSNINFNAASGLLPFSRYSHPLVCDRCGALDYHYVKPLHEIYEPIDMPPPPPPPQLQPHAHISHPSQFI